MHDDHLVGLKNCFEDTEADFYGKFQSPKEVVAKYDSKKQSV
jgi:hypothetical protein